MSACSRVGTTIPELQKASRPLSNQNSMKVFPQSCTHQLNGFLSSCQQLRRTKAHPVTFFERLEDVKKTCKRHCIRPFASLLELEEVYANFIGTIFLNEKERGNLSLDTIKACEVLGQKKPILKALGMTPLCQKCFSFAMGLSLRDMQRKSKQVADNVLQHVRGGASTKGKRTVAGANAFEFLKGLRDNGNFSPITKSVHLGPWPKQEYFRQYKEMYPGDHEGVSLKYFLLLWRNFFQEMRVLKEQRMCPCLVCGKLKDQIAQTDKRDKQKIARHKMELQAHCDDAHEERCAYHETRKYAREHVKYDGHSFTLSVGNCFASSSIGWLKRERTSHTW